MVLQLAAADRRRAERAARARDPVRRHASARDPGSVLCRRCDHRPRFPRGSSRPPRRQRQPDGRQCHGHLQPRAALPHLALVRGGRVHRHGHGDARDQRSEIEYVQDRGRGRSPHQYTGRAHPIRSRLCAAADTRGIADPVLLHRGEPVLMRSWCVAIGLALLLIGGNTDAADTRLADMVLAEVGPRPIMLSEVALARALGLLGLEPSNGPITDAELTNYLDAQLAVHEANQLAIEVSAAAVDRAWDMAGGAALATRLEAVGVDAAWARRLIEVNLRVERFVDLRFRDFAFVTDFDVEEALGPGVHDEAERARTRERLRADMVAKAFASWKDDARRRTPAHLVPGASGPWPATFTLGPRFGGK